MKPGLLIALSVLVFALLPSLVIPCSCLSPGSPTEELEKSDAVFSGKVTAITFDTLRVNNAFVLYSIVTFEVSAAWKGINSEQVLVKTAFESSACGFPFEMNTAYLVYAASENDTLSTNLCTRTKKLSEADEDLEALGTPLVTGIRERNAAYPETPRLYQNYPNPFNPTTKIAYSVPEPGYVKLTVFDIRGRGIQTLVDGIQAAGDYSLIFNADNLANGLYVYKLQVEKFVNFKKMLLLK